MAAPPRKRKIGFTVRAEGNPLFNPPVVEDRYSRVPGSGTYDTVTRKGNKYHRWRGWIDNEKGVRVRRSVYDRTAAGLNRKVKDVQAAPAQSDAKKLLLGDYLTNRFLPAVKLRAKPKTYAGYEQAIRLHIVPHIGKAKLATLQSEHVTAWLTDLDAKPRAKRNAFVTLKVALNHAVGDPDLSYGRSPIEREKAPRAEKREQRILTLAEVHKLLATAKEHFAPWYALVFVALATSMRQGELFALTWRDVDLKQRFLYVRQGVGTVYDDNTESGYRRAITSPKSSAARRRIDLSTEAIALLKSHRKEQKGPNPDALVFPNEAGSFIHASNFNRRVWQPLLLKAELPAITFHSLRHVGNTLLAQEGVSLSLLQQRLGHSSPSTTFIYSHVGKTEGQRSAKLIGSLLGGTKKGTTIPKMAHTRKARDNEKA
jgi:integrase